MTIKVMCMTPLRPSLLVLSLSLACFANALAGTGPTVSVTSPINGKAGQSPVSFKATATSSSCSKGISDIRIYTAPGVDAFDVKSSQLNAFIPLVAGTYNAVVQAWDNCGGVGKTAITITVKPPSSRHHYLYAIEGNGISGWLTNSLTGAISPTGQALVPAHADPYRGATDSTGTHLYVTNVTSNDLSAYTINRTTGYLTQVPGSPYAISRTPTAVAVDPSGKFVYVTADNDNAGDGVAAFSVNPDGSLTKVAGSPFSTQINPQSLLVDSTGKYLYVADASFDGYIDGFTIDQVSGALTPLAGSPFLITPAVGCSGTFASDIAEDVPGGHFYTSDSFDNAISGYSMSTKAGTLTQVQGSAFPDYPCVDPMVAFNPDTLTVVPSGKFLYAGNGLAQTISSYSVDKVTGALHFLNETRVCQNGLSSGPILRSDPSGSFLFTMGLSGKNCTGSNAIVAFGVNPTTGAINAAKGSPAVDSNSPGAVGGAIVVVP
jgi:6-phosphogluconolactonase (cycloisomerase 2 family)